MELTAFKSTSAIPQEYLQPGRAISFLLQTTDHYHSTLIQASSVSQENLIRILKNLGSSGRETPSIQRQKVKLGKRG